MSTSTTLTTFASLQNDTSATSDLNTNFAAVNSALANSLALNGQAPNQMQANLDMNSNRLLNLPAPLSVNEPMRLADANTLNGGGVLSIQGVPTGGTTGQYLAKSSATNFATAWTDVDTGLTAGSGIAITGTTPATISLASNANLGTPSSINLSNGTNLPISTGVSGLGTGVATFLGTPTSTNLVTAVTNGGTGTGAVVLQTAPTINNSTLTGVTLGAGTAVSDPLSYSLGSLTNTATGGNTEYDGTCFYSTHVNNARGVSLSEQYIILFAGYNLTSSSSAQKAFNILSSSAFNLATAVTYHFEAAYYLVNGQATAHTWSTLFGGTAVLNSIQYVSVGNTTSTGAPSNTGLVGSCGSVTANLATPSLSTADNATIWLRGTVRCSTAGTFIPQIQCSAALSGTQTMAANSFFRLWPIGGTSVTNVGNIS